MGKHGQFDRVRAVEQAEVRKMRNQVHPIWRGIGFIMLILLPAIAYLGTETILKENQTQNWFTIPADLYFYNLPDPLLVVKALATFFGAFILFMLFTVLTSFIDKVFGPPRYTPLDAPPGDRRFRG